MKKGDRATFTTNNGTVHKGHIEMVSSERHAQTGESRRVYYFRSDAGKMHIGYKNDVKKLNEDVPTNNVGDGNIAATSPGQEPPGKLKRPYRQGGGGIRTDLIRRWMKGCK